VAFIVAGFKGQPLPDSIKSSADPRWHGAPPGSAAKAGGAPKTGSAPKTGGSSGKAPKGPPMARTGGIQELIWADVY
jgi:hypothetical protein